LKEEKVSNFEPSALPQILFASVWAALLLSSFSKSNAPVDESADRISPNQETGEKNDGSNVLSTVMTKIPPSPETTEQACKCCHHKMPRWEKVLKWLTFIATGGAFIAATVYACIAEHQRKDAEHYSKISHRAWMAPTTGEMRDFEVGKDSYVLVSIYNNGPTPAIDTIIIGDVLVWRKGESVPIRQLFQVKPTEWNGNLIRASGGYRMPFFLRDAKPNPLAITKASLEELKAGKLFIKVYGEVFYDDIFSHHHWVSFCTDYAEETGSFMDCTEGTQMDTDRE
jgi:hypothetical protein